MNTQPPWLLFQLADSAFPTGGFAHSAGLEAAVQLGEIKGEGIARFVEASLWQVGLGVLPFVAAGHAAVAEVAEDERAEAMAALDREVDAYVTNAVQNRASRTQGRALVATCVRIYEGETQAAFEQMNIQIRARATFAHVAPLFGAACAILGASRDEAQQLSLHLALRGVLSAAVRLGVIGPHEAQRMHAAHASTMSQVLTACASLAWDEVAQPAPIFELLGAMHDRLYSRLFQS